MPNDREYAFYPNSTIRLYLAALGALLEYLKYMYPSLLCPQAIYSDQTSITSIRHNSMTNIGMYFKANDFPNKMTSSVCP